MCDKRLHRLMFYWETTKHRALESFVGDAACDLKVVPHSDAPFADGAQASNSTTGRFVSLVGANPFAPINVVCKRQTAISHPSTEAEIVALEHAVRTERLPALSLWDMVVETMAP